MRAVSLVLIAEESGGRVVLPHSPEPPPRLGSSVAREELSLG